MHAQGLGPTLNLFSQLAQQALSRTKYASRYRAHLVNQAWLEQQVYLCPALGPAMDSSLSTNNQPREARLP